MPNRNVAAELVYQLAEYGIKMVFGITGDAMNAFTDALRKDKRITWHTVRHEETAAFAVAAQAELSQELAVCVGTIGPGALHLVNGLYNATRDRSPVLAITGQVPREEAASGYFQEVDQSKAFDDVCVFSETLQSEKQLPRLLQQAMEAAIVKRGVAHIAIPTDLAVTEMPSVTKPNTFFTSSHCIVPGEVELKAAAKCINHCKKPSLLIGCGCRGHREQVIALAEKLNAPVVHALKGSEVLPFDHPLSIGGVGHVGTPHGMQTLENCDLLLMIGTDFPYRVFLPDHGNVIQIDIDPTRLGHRCPIKHGLIGHAGPTIDALLPLLKEKSSTEHVSGLQKKRDRWIKVSDKNFALDKDKVIHPQSVVLKVSELADDDAVFVVEVGEVTVWAARHLRLRGEQRLIGSFNHGSLGVGLPAAIGAQALYPKRQVIALCGDGAFAMLLADLVTASRYNFPLTAIVLNNQKFGFVELEMEASGYPRFATDLVNPDFAKVAEACGCVGIRVEKPEELEEALKTALKTSKPVLIDVMVNPSELILPSKIDLETAWKFTQGKVKEVFVEKNIKVLFER